MPAATVAFAELAAQARIVHVIGTTGLSADDEAKIKAAARHAVIVKSGNMSLGVNLLAALVRQAAKALDADFDIEILEMHHRHKVDAPSGTALLLGKAAAEGRGVDLAAAFRARPRRPHRRAQARRHRLRDAARRLGRRRAHRDLRRRRRDDRTHPHAPTTARIFARGAVKAALWGRGKKPGLYSMADVLGPADS